MGIIKGKTSFLAMLCTISEQMKDILHELTLLREHQDRLAWKLDYLYSRSIAHEAFIDDKLGVFGERMALINEANSQIDESVT